MLQSKQREHVPLLLSCLSWRLALLFPPPHLFLPGPASCLGASHSPASWTLQVSRISKAFAGLWWQIHKYNAVIPLKPQPRQGWECGKCGAHVDQPALPVTHGSHCSPNNAGVGEKGKGAAGRSAPPCPFVCGLCVNWEVPKCSQFLSLLLLPHFLGKEVAHVASWSAQVAGAHQVIAASSPMLYGWINVHVVWGKHFWDDTHIVTIIKSPNVHLHCGSGSSFSCSTLSSGQPLQYICMRAHTHRWEQTDSYPSWIKHMNDYHLGKKKKIICYRLC